MDQHAAALSWLRSLGDPVVDVRLARDLPGVAGPPVAELRARVRADPRVAAVLAGQHGDGSWGPAGGSSRRVLPTLWRAQLLAELGLDAGSERWQSAVGFLDACASTPEGVFSRTGTCDGVLACYVGLAATTYLLGGRRDLAAPQIDWMVRHQEVRHRGRSLRPDGAVLYRPHLRTRYGGCMAESTTCLVGLARNGRALELWRRRGPAPEVEPLLAAVREAFLRRRVFQRADGTVVPVGTPASRADDWLLPTFPTDWRPDLIEVVDLVARSGPADERLRPAVDVLRSHRLPDGSWPLRRSFWPTGVPPIERRSRHRGSRLATARAVCALAAAAPSEAVGRRPPPRTPPWRTPVVRRAPG